MMFRPQSLKWLKTLIIQHIYRKHKHKQTANICIECGPKIFASLSLDIYYMFFWKVYGWQSCMLSRVWRLTGNHGGGEVCCRPGHSQGNPHLRRLHPPCRPRLYRRYHLLRDWPEDLHHRLRVRESVLSAVSLLQGQYRSPMMWKVGLGDWGNTCSNAGSEILLVFKIMSACTPDMTQAKLLSTKPVAAIDSLFTQFLQFWHERIFHTCTCASTHTLMHNNDNLHQKWNLLKYLCSIGLN